MTVWIDADSCPKSVRDLVGRACLRESIPLTFVANVPIPFEPDHSVTMILVPNLAGAADDYLIAAVQPGDLVISRDIPLAAALVDKDLLVLNDRGLVYSRENVRERLSLRNFMQELRERGLKPESTTSFGKKDLEAFAKTFDREFSRLVRQLRYKDGLR